VQVSATARCEAQIEVDGHTEGYHSDQREDLDRSDSPLPPGRVQPIILSSISSAYDNLQLLLILNVDLLLAPLEQLGSDYISRIRRNASSRFVKMPLNRPQLLPTNGVEL
jgi:hypothetical protein